MIKFNPSYSTIRCLRVEISPGVVEELVFAFEYGGKNNVDIYKFADNFGKSDGAFHRLLQNSEVKLEYEVLKNEIYGGGLHLKKILAID